MLRNLLSFPLARISAGTLGKHNVIECQMTSMSLSAMFSRQTLLGVVGNNSQIRCFGVSHCRYDLMEFFDDKKNWGESQVRTGRSWKVDELRIKSNSDLHKLWYILLKERNMLMTLESACKREFELMANPERFDKVEDSMKNLEIVVRERNRAYHLLETGESGERPGTEEENFLGLQEYRQFEEYDVPKQLNKEFLIEKRDEPKSSRKEKSWFLIRFREKQKRMARKLMKRQHYEIIQLLQKFPDLDVEALKEHYPEVNVDGYVKKYWHERHQGNLKAAN